jgi:hypothetical protein
MKASVDSLTFDVFRTVLQSPTYHKAVADGVAAQLSNAIVVEPLVLGALQSLQCANVPGHCSGTTIDCSTMASCKKTCPGFAECASDGWYYCCADAPLTGCTLVHNCSGTAPGHPLLECACPHK